MNIRNFLEFFARQKTWNRLWRLKTSRRINPLFTYSTGIAKYPRTAFLLSFTGVYNVTNNNNTSNRTQTDCSVEDSYLQDLAKELGELERLKNDTLMCKKCHHRLLIDKPIDGKSYCKCESNIAITDESTGWQPFLESKDIIIWRREEQPGTGLHEYKVYGRYEEVTAEDFLSMHTDIEYWKKWDDSALTVTRLPTTTSQKQNQEIIYWETLWPRFFANRDYVYVRRHGYVDIDSKGVARLIKTHNSHNNSSSPRIYEDYEHHTRVDKNTTAIDSDENTVEFDTFMRSQLLHGAKHVKGNSSKIIVLTSQSCEHPNAPETKKAHRVKRYRSDLVIKPFTDTDKPGIEFSLTYFDDPGTNIPSALQSWVAGHACPDFLHKMRLAAGSYKNTPKLPETHEKEEKTTLSDVSNVIEQPIVVAQNTADNVQTSEPVDVKTTEEVKKNDTEEFLNLLYSSSKQGDETTKYTEEGIRVEETHNCERVVKKEEEKVVETKRDVPEQQESQEKHKENNQQSAPNSKS